MRLVSFANADWYLYNFRPTAYLVFKCLRIDMLMVVPPDDVVTNLAQHEIRWAQRGMGRARRYQLRGAARLLSLPALWKAERPGLWDCLPSRYTVHGALAGRVAKVGAPADVLSGLRYVSCNGRIKAGMSVAVQKTRDCDAEPPARTMQSVVARE